MSKEGSKHVDFVGRGFDEPAAQHKKNNMETGNGRRFFREKQEMDSSKTTQ